MDCRSSPSFELCCKKLHLGVQQGNAIDELGLYLTTHPEDTEVLNLYWSYIKLGREGREAYEKQYGPILQTDVTPGSFKWLNDPWPWDLEEEK